MNKILILLLFFCSAIFAQVKIGDNPSVINVNSILELESTNKAFVLTRLTNNQMNAITPLKGAMVYNVDENCVFMYNNVEWKSLCSSFEEVVVTTAPNQPAQRKEGDVWIDNSNLRNVINIWDGTNWIPINSNPKSGVGVPTSQTNLNPLAGDIYVNETTGELYTYNGADWINNSDIVHVTATNGISKTATNEFQLGGDLIKPTQINTSETNTLAIKGVQDATATNDTDVLVVDKNTGVIKKTAPSTLIKEEEIIILAINGQSKFSPPLPITNPKRIDVYRNGVRIKFTVINTTTIEVEPEAVCYAGDEIRIVQIN